MVTDPRERLSALVQRPETAGAVTPAEIPALLAQLAGVQVALLARLVNAGNGNGAEGKASAEPDKLLTAEEAAPILGVTPRWLYRHAGRLPFARRLSRKALRFSEVGVQRYMASRRP